MPPRRLFALLYAWFEERIDPKELDRWRGDLFSPLTDRSPDRVSEQVVDEEMQLFNAFLGK